MGQGSAKAQALLLAAALVLMMICSATASPYNCIPRRLLVASASYYRPPCNDDPIDRPTPRGSNDGFKEISGYRIPRGPPPPTGGHKRAAGTGSAPPPAIY